MLYLNYLFSKYILIVKRFGSLRGRRYISVYYYYIIIIIIIIILPMIVLQQSLFKITLSLD